MRAEEPTPEPQRLRRAALAAILRDRVPGILERLVEEAIRASQSAGGDVVGSYGDGVRTVLPLALDAVAAEDDERERLLDELLRAQKAITERYHVPGIVQRGLVSLGFRFGRDALRASAADSGYPIEDLLSEYDLFRTKFEATLDGD